MKLTKTGLIILIILFLGLFLRIYGLGSESIWGDEGGTLRLISKNLPQIIEELSSQDEHPPLYFIILHYWVNLFGNSEFSTRLPSAIFGFFTIFILYKVGKLLFNKNVGILSSLILSLSVFHINYSQEARQYSLMAMLTLLSFYFFIKLLKKRSTSASIGYIFSSILLLYTHAYGLFSIAAQNIYLITIYLRLKKNYNLNLKKWAMLQITLLILFAPWLWILFKQALRIHVDYIYSLPSLNSIISTFVFISGSFELLWFFIILSFLSIITYKISGRIDWKNISKSIRSYRQRIRLSDINKPYLLLLWLLIPVILPFTISFFLAPIYISRGILGASIAFYLLVAKGVTNINGKYLKSIVIGTIIVLSLINVHEYHTQIDQRFNSEQWRSAVGYIEANSKQGDLLLFNSGSPTILYIYNYYSKRTDLVKRPFPEKTRYVDEEDIKELEPTVEGYKRVWLILSHSRDYEGKIKGALSESYSLSYHKGYAGIEVYLFEKF